MKPFWITAALILLGIPAIALAQTPPERGAQAGQSSDTDMANAAEHRPKTGREARLGGLSAGSIVQSPVGENLGRVKDIVPDAKTGDPAYVVIATQGGMTAVPYATVAPMYQSGHVVLERFRLESAPLVTDSELRDDKAADAEWKKKADRYWEAHHPPSLE
jgi:PRC-barrel domain